MATRTDLTSKHSFLEATVIRRSTLTLTKESPISDDQIISIIKHAILHAPSPFHSQSTRVAILFGAEHDQFWDRAYAASEKVFPPELFQSKFIPNLKSYKGARGTAVFFDDPEVIEKLPPPTSGLIKQFPEWQEHANGMAQYIAWTALCDAGLGCNLQHYQKWLPDLTEKLGVPASWNARAQLVFGEPNGPPRGGVDKQFADIEPRIKVLGL